MGKDTIARGVGRPAGSPNKLSKTAKDNIESVFEMIGGLANMARWAKENETEFYKHYAKLIPIDISAKIDKRVVSVEIKISGEKSEQIEYVADCTTPEAIEGSYIECE